MRAGEEDGDMSDRSQLQQFDRFAARFEPVRTDDLRPGVADWIGRVLDWEVQWLIGPEDESSYEGHWACMPDDHAFPAAWVPSCDLVDLRERVGS